MKSYNELIVEALKLHGGVATLEDIYSYIYDHRNEVNSLSPDYQHTARGRIRELKKRGIIETIAKAKYRLIIDNSLSMKSS